MSQILLVDDEPDFLDSLKDRLGGTQLQEKLSRKGVIEEKFLFPRRDILLATLPDPVAAALETWKTHTDLKMAMIDLEMVRPGQPKSKDIGFLLVEGMKQIRRDARIFILTAYSEHEYLRGAIEVGADGFVGKTGPQPDPPVQAAIFLKAWTEGERALRALVKSIEWRDPATKGHSDRVRDYALHIAKFHTGANGDNLDLSALKVAAELHDLGKLETPDDILLSSDRLSREQRNVLERHVNAAGQIHHLVGPAFHKVAQIAFQHHRAYKSPSHWRLPNYPERSLEGEPLNFENVLLETRILHVADVLDALLSDRSYRPGLPWEKALKKIEEECALGGFDPEVVKTLKGSFDQQEGRRLLHEIERAGHIPCEWTLELGFEDKRLTPGRLIKLLAILSNLYLVTENGTGKAGDRLGLLGIKVQPFEEPPPAEANSPMPVLVRLGGPREDIMEAARVLNRRNREDKACKNWVYQLSSKAQDLAKDLPLDSQPLKDFLDQLCTNSEETRDFLIRNFQEMPSWYRVLDEKGKEWRPDLT